MMCLDLINAFEFVGALHAPPPNRKKTTTPLIRFFSLVCHNLINQKFVSNDTESQTGKMLSVWTTGCFTSTRHHLRHQPERELLQVLYGRRQGLIGEVLQKCTHGLCAFGPAQFPFLIGSECPQPGQGRQVVGV